MDPAIRRYIDENADRYTEEAMRRALNEAGYDPAEVDAALREWSAQRAARSAVPAQRTFTRWSLLLHLAALVVVVGLLAVLYGDRIGSMVPIAGVVLAIVLVLGLAVSSIVGRALLPRAGLTAALAAPVLSVLLIGGSCLALVTTTAGPAPLPATVHLTLTAPIQFESSGSAACFQQPDGISLFAEELGRLPDGRAVHLGLNIFPARALEDGPGASTADPSELVADLSIGFGEPTQDAPPEDYASGGRVELELDASADGRAGTVRFEGLERVDLQEQPARPPSGGTLSGTISWTCG